MADVIVAAADDAEQPRQEPRTWMEVMHPEGTEGTWRDLPHLISDAFRLVWGAGRRELVVTTGLQLLSAVGLALQIFVGQAALNAVLGAEGGTFSSIVPELAALVGITVALNFASAIQAEQQRVLAELVMRRAAERVLDVSTSVDLLVYEDPSFYDRLMRARSQGHFRTLQIVEGLTGLVGAAVAAGGIIFALATLQPLLLPLIVLGYIPLWVVASRNSRDLYWHMHGMTPNERARFYLLEVLTRRDPAKEVRSFELAPFLRRRYDRLYDERIAELRALAKRRTWRSADPREPWTPTTDAAPSGADVLRPTSRPTGVRSRTRREPHRRRLPGSGTPPS